MAASVSAEGAPFTVLPRMLPLAAALVTALAFGGSSSAQAPPGGVDVSLTFGAKPTLRVLTVHPSEGFSVSLGIVSNAAPATTTQVTLDLAAGYTAAPAAFGTPVGLATVAAVSRSSSGFALAFVTGQLIADDPAHYTSDPAALACAAGPYAAVWRFTATVFGVAYVLPIFVEYPAGDRKRVELRFCPPPLTDSTGKAVTPGPVPLASADFLLSWVTGPTARGSYLSSALVTGQGATGAPDPASEVEARSLEPVPHTLTLKGRYDAKSRAAVLTGRVTEAGKPQAGTVVQYFPTDAHPPSQPRQVRTTRTGMFTARVRISSETRFTAMVPDSTGACSAPSSAPRGCATLTVIGSNSRVVTVSPTRR